MSTNLNKRSAIKGILAETVALGIPSGLSGMATQKKRNIYDI